MKIIIPVIDNNKAKNSIAGSFHNTEYACIYNCSTLSYEWIATQSIIKKESNLSTELKRNGISVVISKNMPLMALGFFTESGVTVYKAESGSIEENIQLFTANQLQPLTNATVQNSSDCAGSCSSCHTTCKS